MSERCCCFTGHRTLPEAEIRHISEELSRAIRQLASEGILTFRAGGARGFDTLAALCVLELREELGLRLELYLPCREQTRGWPERDIDFYRHILAASDAIHYVSELYTPDCLLERNRQMVNGCEVCVTYCASSHGGTAYTLVHAMRQGVRIVEIGAARGEDVLHMSDAFSK